MNMPVMPNIADTFSMPLAEGGFSPRTSGESDFLSLLKGLLSSGEEGEEVILNLIQRGSSEQDETTTVDSLISVLSARINGKGDLVKADNFIIEEGEINDILSNLKNHSDNSLNLNENLAQYSAALNSNSLNSMSQLGLKGENSSALSQLQGIVQNLTLDSKDVNNAIKFLQQFVAEDGSLDTEKLLKAIDSSEKDSGAFLNLQHGNSTQSTASIPTKTANIFKSSDIVDVIVENFKTLRLPGRCEMNIRLNPQELGQIAIKLVLEKGQVSAVVSADRRETYMLLQNNISNLLEQIKETGTDLHHITINLNQEQNGEGARRGFNQNEETEDEENRFEDIFGEVSEEIETVDTLI